jgi:hypothetical protein
VQHCFIICFFTSVINLHRYTDDISMVGRKLDMRCIMSSCSLILHMVYSFWLHQQSIRFMVFSAKLRRIQSTYVGISPKSAKKGMRMSSLHSACSGKVMIVFTNEESSPVCQKPRLETTMANEVKTSSLTVQPNLLQ